jgi:hypothetical protein
MADIPTPTRVALARRRYREGMPLKAILAETGLTRTAVHRCLTGDYPDGSGAAPAPIPLRYGGARASHDKTSRRKTGRAALIARMWHAAERQVDEIEQRFQGLGLERGERESEGNARTLAVVARTLRDLAAFDEAGKARDRRPRRNDAPKDDNDETVPRNIDDLRRALAQKLDAFVAGRQNSVHGDSE